MKVKLQIILIPNYFALIPTTNINPDFFKKFVHLVESKAKLSSISRGLTNRFAKLYPEEDHLTIEAYQDKDTFDLDPDFLVNEIFENGDVLRIIVKNTFSANKNALLLAIGAANESADESNISLPPPPAESPSSDRIIPKKRRSPATAKDSRLPGKKRITSGMLVAPPQLDDISGPESVEDEEEIDYNDDEDDDDADIDSEDLFVENVTKAATTSTPTKKRNPVGSSKDMISKSEVMDLFKNKNKLDKKSPSLSVGKRAALMKSLIITMNSDPPSTSNRGTRAAKQAAEIALYTSYPPPSPSSASQSKSKKTSPSKKSPKKSQSHSKSGSNTGSSEKSITKREVIDADLSDPISIATVALQKKSPTPHDTIDIPSDVEYDPNSKLGSLYQKIKHFESHLLKHVNPLGVPKNMTPLPEQRTLLHSEILEPTIELIMNRPKKPKVVVEQKKENGNSSISLNSEISSHQDRMIIDEKIDHELDLPSSEIENHGSLQLVVTEDGIGSHQYTEPEKPETPRSDFHDDVVTTESSSVTGSPSTALSTIASTVDDLGISASIPVSESIRKHFSPSQRASSPKTSPRQANSIFKETTNSGKVRNIAPRNIFSVPKSNSIFGSNSNGNGYAGLRERRPPRSQMHLAPPISGHVHHQVSSASASDSSDFDDTTYDEKENPKISKLVAKLPSIIVRRPYLESKKHKSVTFSDIPILIPENDHDFSPDDEYANNNENYMEDVQDDIYPKIEELNGHNDEPEKFGNVKPEKVDAVVISNAPKRSFADFMKDKNEKKLGIVKLESTESSAPVKSTPIQTAPLELTPAESGPVEPAQAESAPVENEVILVPINSTTDETTNEVSNEISIPNKKDSVSIPAKTDESAEEPEDLIRKVLLPSLDDIESVAEVKEKVTSPTPSLRPANSLSKLLGFDINDDEDTNDNSNDKSEESSDEDEIVNTTDEKFLSVKAVEQQAQN
ncbi:hypothetical protein DFJ63DRAFT_313376 [Scheffersomyces coipomensis]|uniref:uncharacterized protein n=1 Tax=Scheffersomyces coipomensis TaxID=1788519 RepID=UPI00315D4CC8